MSNWVNRRRNMFLSILFIQTLVHMLVLFGVVPHIWLILWVSVPTFGKLYATVSSYMFVAVFVRFFKFWTFNKYSRSIVSWIRWMIVVVGYLIGVGLMTLIPYSVYVFSSYVYLWSLYNVYWLTDKQMLPFYK